ncbi:hypothetical protein SDC9_170377 [bioreactor metagenome]|uniref:Uncharacterized protein n=1 Tax=bioreactor metagenome TaxID=1076179 RepID=A0A645GAI9_9ZZZZ
MPGIFNRLSGKQIQIIFKHFVELIQHCVEGIQIISNLLISCNKIHLVFRNQTDIIGSILGLVFHRFFNDAVLQNLFLNSDRVKNNLFNNCICFYLGVACGKIFKVRIDTISIIFLILAGIATRLHNCFRRS